MGLHTILGANGTVADALFPVLAAQGHQIRLVSRSAKSIAGAENVAANLLNQEQVFKAVRGSEIVYLLVGLTYNAKIWQSEWPIVIRNVMDACKASDAKLVFFDNVYMYGKVEGIITEETTYQPSSKKGKVRAGVATALQQEMAAGKLKAIIARAVDFY